MVWEHNLTRHLLTQDRIWNLKIKNSVKYHLTKHIVSSKIITLEGIGWRRQISFFPNGSTHKDQRRIGVDRRLLKDPFLDTHLVQSNNIFQKIKSKERQKNEFPHLVSRYVWQPAAAEREAWCSSCRSRCGELWLLPATQHRLLGFKGVQAALHCHPVLILELPLDVDAEEIDWLPLLPLEWVVVALWGSLFNVSQLSGFYRLCSIASFRLGLALSYMANIACTVNIYKTKTVQTCALCNCCFPQEMMM